MRCSRSLFVVTVVLLSTMQRHAWAAGNAQPVPFASDQHEPTPFELARDRTEREVVLVGLLAIWAVLLIHRARAKRHTELEETREQLSRDLHDDIGSTLSSISILSDVTRQRAAAAGDEHAADALTRISERSQRLMRDMSDIVWTIDPHKDTMADVMSRMREFGIAVLDPLGVAFRFQQAQELRSLRIEPLLKKNLYLIFKEAISNAGRHAQARHVEASIGLETGVLVLRVQDDGIGLPAGHTPSGLGGNGLVNMRERAEELKAELEIGTDASGGTHITLRAPLGC